MGGNGRGKHVRPSRKSRSVKPESDPFCFFDKEVLSKAIVQSRLHDLIDLPSPLGSAQDVNTNSNSNLDDNGWGYCTEEQLEEILLKRLECVYNEALSKLMALGYEEDVALGAILNNGNCYGGMDILKNILHNTLAYLNSTRFGSSKGNNEDQSETGFTDLRQLQEYSLTGMVYLLQQVKPNLSKGDAMWCLLMSELNVGRASTMDVSSSRNGASSTHCNVEGVSSVNGVGAPGPSSCRFHGGQVFGNGGGQDDYCGDMHHHSYSDQIKLRREIDCPSKFNLSPSKLSWLKINVAAFAAGYRASMSQLRPHASGYEHAEACELPRNSGSEESISSVLEKFRDLNLDENLESSGDDQKDDVIVNLLLQINELEKQVKERKEWAQKKAIQAAQKVSDELNELRRLKSEREETQRLNKCKQSIEDSTVKRISEMENELRKASSKVDKANAAVRKLENENAEIRAEIQAAKLSAAESLTATMEETKKQRKCSKKHLAWEKQRLKLEDEITALKAKVKAHSKALAQIMEKEKENEVKWIELQKAKEEAIAKVEEEQRSKEAVEAHNKRKLETLRLKIEIDFQRHKDDLQRLEQELSRLKSSSSSTAPSAGPSVPGQGVARLLEELDRMDETYKEEEEENMERECMICMNNEVSVVFLPCAHQVVCASCNDSFIGNKKKGGKMTCPCCKGVIHERIRVFGASC